MITPAETTSDLLLELDEELELEFELELEPEVELSPPPQAVSRVAMISADKAVKYLLVFILESPVSASSGRVVNLRVGNIFPFF